MKFKLDENLPVEAAEVFRDAGYDACTVLEQDLGGTKDAHLAAICTAERRALVTLDVDFANLRAYPPGETSGYVVLRLRHQDKATVVAALVRLLPLLASEPLPGHLWVVGDESVRIRGA